MLFNFDMFGCTVTGKIMTFHNEHQVICHICPSYKILKTNLKIILYFSEYLNDTLKSTVKNLQLITVVQREIFANLLFVKIYTKYFDH